ncbi:hypothetical protein CCR94_17225 [Rhodoblastus sphagnicola]|uniref:DUF262 domain-containing protein n=1 Tax=Rhodoblastus sphagnicola TaxID=333368 RepID=A0A2S6N217_9HYPH|nr:DUF262 domain-containing protein [Rhodoblastus sphagnicola]MBB4199724.1 hypothetical protein [Rhodoblastus sphagnicola]PPQ28664.1 hypothetical protein CCR94_17225 [Rhodoblastus sphagnicola]
MKNLKQPIRRIVSFLNNRDEDGGFWLPNIQRPFVWSEDQICRLFDSIMREYPLSTLLVWKTTNGIRRRKFIDNWKPTLKLSDFYVPEDQKKKCLVLDGQQRLQSLFIGLCGSYEGRELYFDITSGELSAPDDIKFRFAFKDKSVAQFPWIKFKELVFTTMRVREMRDKIAANSGREITPAETEKIEDHLNQIERTFKMDEAIAYQELDSIDNPNLYKEDDVVEIFIRANSGGTKLGKSDLLFSLLNASWEVADEKMEGLLESLNQHGFEFDRDFVLKSCLVLTGQGARYEVQKFRKPGVREGVEASWDAISRAMIDVLDFVRGKTFIQCDRALPSYLVLIPLMYLRYKYPEQWKVAKDIDTYLLRSLFAKAFSGQPDNLLDALVRKIDELGGFSLDEAFNVIRSQGRSLEITEQQLWHMGYGSDTIHLLFNLWYRSFNHTPAYVNNFPEIDHIFPQSVLRGLKVTNPETGRPVMRYREHDRNQLANCMLLTKGENGPGGKGATLPEDWFADKDDAYLDKHLIPKDKELWALDRFDDFILARMKLIKQRFQLLLVS